VLILQNIRLAVNAFSGTLPGKDFL
jgi:hypothetical protein